MNVVGYTRVSTDEQAHEGVSLAAQEERIRAYCVAKGWTLICLFTDAGESAKTLDRPALQNLLIELPLRDGIDVEALVVLKLDRLTRSIVDLHAILAWCEKHAMALVAVEEALDATTASGRLMLNILTSVSQWEREAIGERTKTALGHLKSQGQRYCGEAPYGYQWDGDLAVHDPHEQEILKQIRACAKSGMGPRTIGRYLAVRGIVARNGRAFHPQTVAQIIARLGDE